MRLRLDALLEPVDPVVAMHVSSRDADAAIAALRRAGYGSRMLSVVGQAHAGADPADRAVLPSAPARGRAPWAASGAGLGLLWALFTAGVVAWHPAGAAAFVGLITAAVLTLALQAAVMAHVVAPEPGLPRDREPGPSTAPAGDGDPARRFLVVVHGSRSEVGLARDILAAR